MNGTPRLSLPFLSPGQAQKEFTHNEALQILDAVVAAQQWRGHARIRRSHRRSVLPTSSAARRPAHGLEIPKAWRPTRSEAGDSSNRSRA